MITGFLLTILLVFFNFVLGLLSGVVLATGIQTHLTGFFAYIWQWNELFPVDTAFLLLSYAVKFWILVFTWSFLKFVLHYVRGN